MSRTIGPYKDVATARVEGAYELCEGVDETGRPVQILTLGSSSSKDPGRRGLLSDTVAWAYATAASDDAPILVADLEGEQPYVVVLRDPRLRGADRILDRLLNLGPSTGPLPVGAAAAAHRPQAPASPAGPTPSAPPMSPVAIAAPKRRSQIKPILIGIASVAAMVGLVVGGWIVWTTLDSSDQNSGAATPPASEEPTLGEEAPDGAAEEAPEDTPIPSLDPDAREVSLAGDRFSEEDSTMTVALREWPFAFRVPDDFTCDADGPSVDCVAPDGESTVSVQWSDCPDPCRDDRQEELREALPFQPLQVLENGEDALSVRTPYGEWKASLSVFAATSDGTLHVTAVVDAQQDRTDAVQPILNDVFNQANALVN